MVDVDRLTITLLFDLYKAKEYNKGGLNY